MPGPVPAATAAAAVQVQDAGARATPVETLKADYVTQQRALSTTALDNKASVLKAGALEKQTEVLVALTETCEVLVQSAGGLPLAGEKCLLRINPHQQMEGVTDDQGVVRFTYFKVEGNFAEPLLILPELLEGEYQDADYKPGDTEVTKPADGNARKRDSTAHGIQPGSRVTVRPALLTMQEKFNHFVRAYTDNGARYFSGSGSFGGMYSKGLDNYASEDEYQRKKARGRIPQIWKWIHGAVCNQHVNFFLGYWFNYNEAFTTRASTTNVCAATMHPSGVYVYNVYDSQDKVWRKYPHRGYTEFLEPVPFGITNIKRATNFTALTAGQQLDRKDFNEAYRHARYLRLSEYFTSPRGVANDKGRLLVAALGDYNVYSVCSLNSQDKLTAAWEDVLRWIRSHLEPDAALKTRFFVHHDRVWLEKDIRADARKKGNEAMLARLNALLTDPNTRMTRSAVILGQHTWNDYDRVMWNLDPDRNTAEADLVRSIQAHLETDHHGGVLFKKNGELYTFSADGEHKASWSDRRAIQVKAFTAKFTGQNDFSHYAIWKLKSLRPGGYPPQVTGLDAEGKPQAVPVHLDAPPRFIDFTAHR